MAINIKSQRVQRLLDEVTALTGETKTEAIRRALEERRDRLTRGGVNRRPLSEHALANLAPWQHGYRDHVLPERPCTRFLKSTHA